eukprot:gnl/Spiro4/11860_TR6261_c0_g1_i1.p1 gnl/Spiro4/11860_TR6261_c0_g1~~gnl/Spiro4/11860_TR6261_c0_g1_i1.p1  ORF type:complete len:164 (-),score=27.20 gnl/Spiro4/11860_TR6261_c0_g1_i1:49-540(-)
MALSFVVGKLKGWLSSAWRSIKGGANRDQSLGGPPLEAVAPLSPEAVALILSASPESLFSNPEQSHANRTPFLVSPPFSCYTSSALGLAVPSDVFAGEQKFDDLAALHQQLSALHRTSKMQLEVLEHIRAHSAGRQQSQSELLASFRQLFQEPNASPDFLQVS